MSLSSQRFAPAWALILLVAGCRSGGPHSTLAPAGPQAAHIDQLWWTLLWVCGVVFAIVLVALVTAFFRSCDEPDKEALSDDVRHGVHRVISFAVAGTLLALVGLFVATVWADRKIAALDGNEDALTITVTGKQWWWDVTYESENPHEILTTANEIHIPTGQPVKLRLVSADVIHSFWVPALHGKRDLIPGRENHLWIQADRTGVFEGQCAEFCGHQHAHMRIRVVAQQPAEFAAWLAHQRSPGREPVTESEWRGREVFVKRTCVMCHTIRGTLAASNAGPDLTHLASRQTLAAGALPNTRGHLAGWILDPQGIKPGSRMPAHALTAEELHPLLDYLESLK